MTDTQQNSEQQPVQSLHIGQQDIHLISQYSRLSEQSVQYALKKYVYNDQKAWQTLLQWLLLGLGISFFTVGIIFFFAYNWADLHKFIKIGLIEGILIIVTMLTLIHGLNPKIKNMILIGAAGLVGVLFAVFGQIYQTGANAYDFFLAWSVFIMLWVIVSNFAALWLLFLVLINTTLVLYSQQVAYDWSFIYVATLLFMLNTIVLIVATWLTKYQKSVDIPDWFLNIIALTASLVTTLGLSVGIFEQFGMDFLVLFLITTLVYILAMWHAFKIRSSFYLAVLPFSITIILSACLLDWFNSDMTFLPVSIFIVIAVTLIIKKLIYLQKQWKIEG